MDENHRQMIKDNIDKLSEECNFSNILEFLKYRNIFTKRELLNYASPNFQQKPEEERCRQIFTDIQTRGPTAFKVLLECLQATGHAKQHLLLKPGRVAVLPQNDSIAIKKSKSFPRNQDVYKMKSYPKGLFIFINNIKFERAVERDGAEKDEEFIDILREMGFSGDNAHNNKTVQEMWDLLLRFSSQETLAKVDSCIVLISSHGDILETRSRDRNITERELYIDGVDDITSQNAGNHLLCKDIIALFNSDQCKLRKGCPKIFILQACRGPRSVHRGKADGPISKHLKQTHPNWRDTFLLAPSMEGFKANRDPERGSWLFMALKEVFPEHAYNKDLETMKNLMNKCFDEYARKSSDELQQTLSYYEYGVSKKLYFSPGLHGSRWP